MTNQWTNRIIGDSQLPEDKKILRSTGGMRGFDGNSTLKESGLLGPVVLFSNQSSP